MRFLTGNQWNLLIATNLFFSKQIEEEKREKQKEEDDFIYGELHCDCGESYHCLVSFKKMVVLAVSNFHAIICVLNIEVFVSRIQEKRD